MCLIKKIPFSIVFFLFIFGTTRCSEDEIPFYVPVKVSTNSDDFVFFHLSDTHGGVTSLQVAAINNENPNVDFSILTGDIFINPNVAKAIAETPKPLLIIPGNHDSYDFSSEFTFRRDHLDCRAKDSLQFADDIHNYWYRDFEKQGRRLRVIGLDQYQIQTLNDTISNGYEIMMSQQQIDWFCETLKNAADYDGVMVILHAGLGNKNYNARNTNYINEFISIDAHKFDNGYDYTGWGNPLIITDIVKAYKTGENITNKQYASGCCEYPTLNVNTSFTRPSDNFIAFFGGHIHWDVVEKLPNYDILQVLVAYCGEGTGADYDDIVRGIKGQTYMFNVNIIDFNDKTIKIKREGAHQRYDYGTRDSICFNWQTCEIVNK